MLVHGQLSRQMQSEFLKQIGKQLVEVARIGRGSWLTRRSPLIKLPSHRRLPVATTLTLNSPMRRIVPLLVLACLSPMDRAQSTPVLQPPANQHVVLVVQGRGSQVYACQSTGPGWQWVFQSPVARLFDDKGVEVGTHGDGPSWTLQDSSTVQGVLISKMDAPAPTDIPWLLLKAVNPQRKGILLTTDYITRTDTHGGVPPATGCDATHKGDLIHIPYAATYTFYSSAVRS